jgi:very-short-patch-repair endonuclease
MVGPIDRFRRATARRLRANATDAEMRLWRHLRRLPTFGSHFRRQVPVGPYVVDFACMAARLIIEVDRSQHGNDANMARDQVRTRWLTSEGYKVLRFWNNDIVQNMDGVLEAVYVALYGTSEPKHLKHERRSRSALRDEAFAHPTPARFARRPSPSRGG